jgi:hypothetical protein
MFVDTQGWQFLRQANCVPMRNARFLVVEIGLERARVKLDSNESDLAGAGLTDGDRPGPRNHSLVALDERQYQCNERRYP